MVFSLCKHS